MISFLGKLLTAFAVGAGMVWALLQWLEDWEDRHAI